MNTEQYVSMKASEVKRMDSLITRLQADNKLLREIAFSLLNALRLYAPDAVHLVNEARAALEGKE